MSDLRITAIIHTHQYLVHTKTTNFGKTGTKFYNDHDKYENSTLFLQTRPILCPQPYSTVAHNKRNGTTHLYNHRHTIYRNGALFNQLIRQFRTIYCFLMKATGPPSTIIYWCITACKYTSFTLKSNIVVDIAWKNLVELKIYTFQSVWHNQPSWTKCTW